MFSKIMAAIAGLVLTAEGTSLIRRDSRALRGESKGYAVMRVQPAIGNADWGRKESRERRSINGWILMD